ncbi:hypothetical protein [Streptomyces noursei]|uniref:Uncharacterized protein n=1 Tax=Streptomyces noursei TaxID=1971 RepID=A0A2N8PQV6_STRNR|nr:hypothetical protein [Streptomyces noursei]PNE43387.1 hypothetical protein AOB60_00105 [Streptomyces noursei]
MRYELDATKNRMAHEYKNTETGESEEVQFYGSYTVEETFLMPDGQVLVLAYDETASQPFAVGVHNASMGTYWSDGNDARRNYAWRIAESFGLTVEEEGSKAMVTATRDYATDLVEQLKRTGEEWERVVQDEDADPLMEAGAAVWTNATSLAKHLQRSGVLTHNVYESWEVVG